MKERQDATGGMGAGGADGGDGADDDAVASDWWKRPFDLCAMCGAHIALAPVWLLLWTLIPLAIWLHDRGPVFYTQARQGKGGKVFKMYKFRSMSPDAERETGAVWAGKNDPRITPVGRLLRAYAMDELPQVINIWKGDISLVGPRPERPELSEEFMRRYPGFRRRLLVRPGLTGLAQVRSKYSTPPERKIRYDCIYIKRMSPLLDIKILLLSVWLTARGKWQEDIL